MQPPLPCPFPQPPTTLADWLSLCQCLVFAGPNCSAAKLHVLQSCHGNSHCCSKPPCLRHIVITHCGPLCQLLAAEQKSSCADLS